MWPVFVFVCGKIYYYYKRPANKTNWGQSANCVKYSSMLDRSQQRKGKRELYSVKGCEWRDLITLVSARPLVDHTATIAQQ